MAAGARPTAACLVAKFFAGLCLEANGAILQLGELEQFTCVGGLSICGSD